MRPAAAAHESIALFHHKERPGKRAKKSIELATLGRRKISRDVAVEKRETGIAIVRMVDPNIRFRSQAASCEFTGHDVTPCYTHNPRDFCSAATLASARSLASHPH